MISSNPFEVPYYGQVIEDKLVCDLVNTGSEITNKQMEFIHRNCMNIYLSGFKNGYEDACKDE